MAGSREQGAGSDPLRDSARADALEWLEAKTAEHARPGKFVRLELVLQDGIVETLREEEITKVRLLKVAA